MIRARPAGRLWGHSAGCRRHSNGGGGCLREINGRLHSIDVAVGGGARLLCSGRRVGRGGQRNAVSSSGIKGVVSGNVLPNSCCWPAPWAGREIGGRKLVAAFGVGHTPADERGIHTPTLVNCATNSCANVRSINIRYVAKRTPCWTRRSRQRWHLLLGSGCDHRNSSWNRTCREAPTLRQSNGDLWIHAHGLLLRFCRRGQRRPWLDIGQQLGLPR